MMVHFPVHFQQVWVGMRPQKMKFDEWWTENRYNVSNSNVLFHVKISWWSRVRCAAMIESLLVSILNVLTEGHCLCITWQFVCPSEVCWLVRCCKLRQHHPSSLTFMLLLFPSSTPSSLRLESWSSSVLSWHSGRATAETSRYHPPVRSYSQKT